MDPEIEMDQQPVPEELGEPDLTAQEIVKKEILERIEDSLRVERDWRDLGQKIQKIYKGELSASGGTSKASVRFNVLNSNVSILLPSLYSQAPKPEIRSKASLPNPIEDNIAEGLQKTTEVFLDDKDHSEAFKSAIKEMLLPGRGTVRVRWDPIVESKPIADPLTGQPALDSSGNPAMQQEKLLDQLYIEHVYWEDYTHEAVAQWKSCGWMAYRHLMTEKEFLAQFSKVKSVNRMLVAGTLSEIFKWTDASANRLKTNNNSRSSTRGSNEGLQDVIKKALVWEYWDKSTREVIWICQDMDGAVLRIDPDFMNLRDFFPSPMPLLSITTTDSLLPTPEYFIYQDLAQEIDELSDRIAAITRRIKIRGAYDASQENLANILRAEDGEMIAINGHDLNKDLSNHLYIVPITELVQALQALYQARDAAKQSMYEVTGISDIIRGQTRASETLGAQRIKSQFATLRIEDRKKMVEEFARKVIAIISEVICENFSPESIYYYSGVEIMPEAFMMLRSDGMRISKIDVESDSTITVDETADQQSMSSMLQALGLVMQQIMPMVQTGTMPLPIAIELLKLATRPFKHSRNLATLLDKYMTMLMGGSGMPPQPGLPAPQPTQEVIQ